MPTYESSPQFEHGRPESTGILLINLGTPDAPTTGAVRRFLKQFLSDPRVVEYPRALWWLILNLVILVIRPRRSASAYRKIWTKQGSPLMFHCRAIANELQDKVKSKTGERLYVELAMTYGEPSVANAIDKLLADGVQRILVLPLYPQYSGTTTAAAFDAVYRKMGKLRRLPELRFINNYHDAPGYIRALAEDIRAYWATHGRAEKLLMSFHGVPTSTLLNGDPYHCQCQKTARLLVEELELQPDDWLISFQSRVGREQWLTPYTDETVTVLGAEGLSSLEVVCPGFSVDCLETLEEIAMQNAEFFTASGGGELRYIPALNAGEHHVRFLMDLAEAHTAGWSDTAGDATRSATRARARAMGATV